MSNEEVVRKQKGSSWSSYANAILWPAELFKLDGSTLI